MPDCQRFRNYGGSKVTKLAHYLGHRAHFWPKYSTFSLFKCTRVSLHLFCLFFVFSPAREQSSRASIIFNLGGQILHKMSISSTCSNFFSLSGDSDAIFAICMQFAVYSINFSLFGAIGQILEPFEVLLSFLLITPHSSYLALDC